MKKIPFYLILLSLFSISAISMNAAQLGTAKVIEVSGSATRSSENGATAPLQKGDILREGDSISTKEGTVKLVFSNGSELSIDKETRIKIAKLVQDLFQGNLSYEQLQADPSKSELTIVLNYGVVTGNVKDLQPGSKVYITTPLGTADIRGANFKITLMRDSGDNSFVLNVFNVDGRIDLLGNLRGTLSDSEDVKNGTFVNPQSSQGNTTLIPMQEIATILMKPTDPLYEALFGAVNFPDNYAPFPLPVPTPPVEVNVISPENGG
jgi:hypothetical protein